MPCLDEKDHIEACLDVALGQDYPADRLEIIVADGGSTDGTRALLERSAAAEPRLTVIDNPGRIQSAGLNEILRRARGEVFVRMDVHADYAPDYVRKCVEVLERTGADNAGGAARARSRTPFQRALCAALESPLGVGGSAYRSADNEGFVETVFNGAFRRRVFEEIGLYDPRAITNEDAELNQRILDAGGKIYLSREIVAWYYPRDSFRSLARQYFKYGKGRARTLLKHRRLLSLRPAIPFLMVTGGAALLATSPLQPLTPWIFGAYGALCVIEAVRVGRAAGLAAVPRVAAIFPVLHVAHGLGFGAGLLHYLRRPDWDADERLAPASAAPR
jgi:succinoglycan biosynthesis protein ExoA